MSNEPSPDAKAATLPDEYGVEVTPETMLPWNFVEERLRAASNYWLTTVVPGGRPHTRPVDGVWVEGALCFGGSPQTRWVRNLQQDARVSINLGSETEAVILEGTAELITDAGHPLAAAFATASQAKYPQYYDGAELPPFRPFWCLHPDRAYAWTLAGFATTPTRWDFRS